MATTSNPCPVCGHSPHPKACRVRLNVGTIHETICGCNAETLDPDLVEQLGDQTVADLVEAVAAFLRAADTLRLTAAQQRRVREVVDQLEARVIEAVAADIGG